jgi:TatD DNase family protein
MTNLPELFEKYCREYPSLSYVRFALGLHPELVKDYPQKLSYFLSLLPKARYLGEIGLDYSTQRSADDVKAQRKVFERIIAACKECTDPKILSIHNRAAVNDVIDIVGKYQVILHWLSDKNVRMDEAIDNGYYFSINSQMASFQSGQALIRKMPTNKILVESDAPFTDQNRRDYTVEQLTGTVGQLAAIYKVSLEQMQDIVSGNFKRLLNDVK